MAVLLCAILAASDPSAAQRPPPAPSPATPSVAGTWRGEAAVGPETRVELTFELRQTGERVHGTYDSRSPVLIAVNVRVTGTLRGDALTLFEEGTATPVVEARVQDSTLTGVYRGSSGPAARLDARRLR